MICELNDIIGKQCPDPAIYRIRLTDTHGCSDTYKLCKLHTHEALEQFGKHYTYTISLL